MDWIREESSSVDAESKMEVHVLRDCFGTKQLVQLSLLTDTDPDGKLTAEKDAMTQRAKDFANVLCGRGLDPQKFVTAGWGDIPKSDCPNCGK